MNHAQLALIVLDDLVFYLTAYLLLLVFYLVLYRKIYWGLFDPMIWTVVNITGGAFCVFFLYNQGELTPFYKWSFLTTEITMFTALSLTAYLPKINFTYFFGQNTTEIETEGISEFDVFTWLIGIIYIFCEIVSFLTIGIVLLDDEVNHVSAFADHGILMAFITSYRLLCPLVLFYKMLILKRRFSFFDIICWIFAGLGILTTGSKSAILVFVFEYFIIQYPLIRQGKIKPLKLSLPLILALLSFPVLVIAVGSGADTMIAVQGVFIRLLSSGDIFLLGYNDTVMNLLSEKSFMNYAFYPGFGTILKNLGFNFVPPEALGSDILEYHYGKRDGGPNSRYNYLALHFFGFWGAILYSAIIGLIVGVIRNSFKNLDPHKTNYFGYLFITLIVYLSPSLIDDILIFSNYVFWRLFFLTFSYIASKILFIIIKKRALSLSTE